MPDSYLSNIDLGDGTTRIIRDRLAISTEASQDITDTQKSNARENLGLGTASTRSVPSNGNANATQVVLGSDTRLTNARPCADNFVGSTSQWNALSSTEKDQYNTVDLTNDSGGGGGGGGASNLTDLGDVAITTPSNGQVIKYNANTQKWENDDESGGGSTYTAGDGIDITNDVISTKQSEQGDIDEIIDAYPQAGELVSIVNAFNRGDLYSTDEKMIGQWISGKPLYQKTVATSGEVPSGATLIERITQTGYDTIRYTKDSDTAISIGSETAYSTDEKVVGTWIDGKPIFQKTIQTTMPNCTSSGTSVESYVNLGVSVDVFVDVRGFFRITDGADMPLNTSYKVSSSILYNLVRGIPNSASSNANKIYLSNSNKNWNGFTTYVTVQYTKTTT